MINQEPVFCFTHTDDRDVYLFTLSNKNGTVVTITNYGAIVTSFKVLQKDGKLNDIVLGFDTVEEYLGKNYLSQYPWFGAAIGRYSNRIRNASFTLEGSEYSLSKNDGNNQLHGGLNGFDKKVWQLAGQGNAPQPWLELSYQSPDGEEGFPGNLQVSIRFELSEENELSYSYKATTDRPTAVNLTHHEYFNLDNSGETMTGQEIRIYSSGFLAQDETLASTGAVLPVEHSPFDLRQFVRIKDGLERAGDYDLSFVIDTREDQLVAEARSLRTGLLLQVYSTEPALHFYTGKWIPSISGKNGHQYQPYSGFCLEAHIHPDAVNHSDFPNTILYPGEVYYQKTRYKISHI